MRVRPSIASLLIVAAGPGCSRTTSGTAPGETHDAGPVFGVVAKSLTHRFEVVNSTDRPVRVLGESHSCTCTVVELERGVLQPGQSVPLTLRVDLPLGHAGREVSCLVETDHPRFPEWAYKLKYTNYPKAQVVPERLDLGVIALGNEERSRGRSSELPHTTACPETYAPPDRNSPRPVSRLTRPT